MEISNATIGLLAAACITAGAAGTYVVNRSASPSPEAPVTVAQSDTSTAAGVEQSEAIVADPPAPALTVPESSRPDPQEAAPRPNAQPRPAARTERPRATRTREVAAAPASLPAVTNDASHLAIPPPEPIQAAVPEPVRPAEPPSPQFVDLVVSTDSVLGLQVETSLTSERARVEDEVVARVTRDVRVGDRVAIPAGAKAHGEVTLVDRGGKVRDRARLGIRFTSVVLADGTRIPLDTDTIYREGDAPSGESAAKIGGGAIGGAILGGIFGGAKGAVLGGTAGAGAGTAAVMAGGRNAATLPSGTPVTVRLVKPATVTVED